MMSSVMLLTSTLFTLLVLSTMAEHNIPCSESFMELARSRNATNCKKLSTLGAQFAWELDKSNKRRVTIIFSAKLKFDYGWLAWGVNPGKSPQMVGTRAIIGIRQLNGSLYSNTYNITMDVKLGCQLLPSKIDVDVVNHTLEFVDAEDLFILQATLVLPVTYNITLLNHVWQIGDDVVDDIQPKKHPHYLENLDSTGTIDLKTGVIQQHAFQSRKQLRSIHGILNILGWGVLLLVGVIIARYFRFPIQTKPESLWYYLHIWCQMIGYLIGSTGWFIGLWLGNASAPYTFHVHRLLGIFIFAFVTLQMLAIKFKPGKNDPIRRNWNVYHHFLGFSLIALITVNIFVGINNLKPHDTNWRWTYIAILASFAAITAGFEAFSWYKFKHPDQQDTNREASDKNMPIHKATSSKSSTQGGSIQPISSLGPSTSTNIPLS